VFVKLLPNRGKVCLKWREMYGWDANVSKKKKKCISRKLVVIRVSVLCYRNGNLWKYFMPVLRACAAHICHDVRNHLSREMEMAGRWIGRSGPIAWPPRSPDLTPLYIFFWSYVKNIVYQVKINDLQHLEARTRDVVATVTCFKQHGTRSNNVWICVVPTY
jgi:hypothetical protein